MRVPFILAGPGVRPRRIHQAAGHFCYATVWIAVWLDVKRLRDVLAAVLESQDPEPRLSFPSGPRKVASLHAPWLDTTGSSLPPWCTHLNLKGLR